MSNSQKPKNAADGMKQKSLMGWFAKGGGSEGSQSAKSQPKAKPARTPERKTLKDTAALSSSMASVRSSGAASSIKDTPPTSDAVDVDMMSVEELEPVPSKSVSVIVLDASTVRLG